MRPSYDGVADYLLKKSALDPETGCIEWIGILSKDGYGRVDLQCLRNKGVKTSHRANYELHHGTIPQGMHIDHLCRNRKCLNINHLRCVTPQENWATRVWDPANVSTRKGMESHFSKLTNQQIIEIRERRSAGEKLRIIAAHFGISEGLVSMIHHRKVWAHL